MPVVFFDIGDTLATPVFTQDDWLEGFNVFPEARTALASVKQRGLRMGIISNPGNENPDNVNLALDRAGLLNSLPPRSLFTVKRIRRLFLSRLRNEQACPRLSASLSVRTAENDLLHWRRVSPVWLRIPHSRSM